jgi:archaemetzincin
VKKKLIWLLLAAAILVWLAVGLKPLLTPDERVAAIGDVSDLPEEMQRALDPGDFTPLLPGESYWLAAHPEPGQTFDQFKSGRFHRPDAQRKIIYLQPIGEWPAADGPALSDLSDCAQAYFGLDMQTQAPLSIEGASITTRPLPGTGKRQLLTADLHDLLAPLLPQNGFCILGIADEDLYPDPNWGWVYGEVIPKRRVGVFSFVRTDPRFFGRQRGPNFEEKTIRRSCKILTHEIGHIFGLEHCIHYRCGMNGSNNPTELNLTPIHLCPICLRKLQHSIGFDVADRYRNLGKFYERTDLKAEADWARERLKKIQAP